MSLHRSDVESKRERVAGVKAENARVLGRLQSRAYFEARLAFSDKSDVRIFTRINEDHGVLEVTASDRGSGPFGGSRYCHYKLMLPTSRVACRKAAEGARREWGGW